MLKYNNFGWDITGNFATAHNKVISLGGLPSLVTSAGQYNVEGFPIESFFTRKVVSATVDPTTGAAIERPVRWRPRKGRRCVRRLLRSCTSGQPTPTSTGSIGNTFTLFKKLRLYALVDWKRGNRLFNAIDSIGAPARWASDSATSTITRRSTRLCVWPKPTSPRHT